jgi:histidinol-phosphate aminotransferase
MPEFRSFLRSHLASLPPYTPIEPFEILSTRLNRQPEAIIKLDANENPYGPSPRARSALAGLTYPHIYPDPESRALRTALEKFCDVPMDHLLAASGSDELIDLIMRVFVEPGEYVLTCPPTFGMYSFDTRVNAGQIVEVPRKADFSLDLEAVNRAVEEYKPKLLFVATPNNPDGSLISPDILGELLKLPLIVVLDEAYIEFCDLGRLGGMATRIRQVIDCQNLIVLRTFSKWAGLAGLRVGYGAFPAWLMPVLWNAKQPYNVNTAASTAAIASLEDLEYLGETISTLQAERRRLYQGLSLIPTLRPYPSQANFILCQVIGDNALRIKEFLSSEHGILVRYFNTPGLKDHIRISVGRPQDTDTLLRALNL